MSLEFFTADFVMQCVLGYFALLGFIFGGAVSLWGMSYNPNYQVGRYLRLNDRKQFDAVLKKRTELANKL